MGHRLVQRLLKRQRAHMSGDLNQAKILRNKVNRVASKLTYNFYQTQIAAMHESGSHDWWKHMKTVMGLKTNGKSCMQGLAKKQRMVIVAYWPIQ